MHAFSTPDSSLADLHPSLIDETRAALSCAAMASVVNTLAIPMNRGGKVSLTKLTELEGCSVESVKADNIAHDAAALIATCDERTVTVVVGQVPYSFTPNNVMILVGLLWRFARVVLNDGRDDEVLKVMSMPRPRLRYGSAQPAQNTGLWFVEIAESQVQRLTSVHRTAIVVGESDVALCRYPFALAHWVTSRNDFLSRVESMDGNLRRHRKPLSPVTLEEFRARPREARVVERWLPNATQRPQRATGGLPEWFVRSDGLENVPECTCLCTRCVWGRTLHGAPKFQQQQQQQQQRFGWNSM